MPLHPTTINVYPNPWCVLDGEGRPAGVCHVDPDIFGVARVGARIKSVDVEQLSPSERTQRRKVLVAPRQSIEWEFDLDKPTTLKCTGDCHPVVVRAIRCGDLIAADETAAKLAGVKFVEPKEALAKAKAAAIAKFDATYFPGAYAQLASDRGETTEMREPESYSGDQSTQAGSDDSAKATPATAGKKGNRQ